MSEADYSDRVNACKEYIAAGDIYQIVLSVLFRGKTDVAPFEVYRALRLLNPSPYMYFIDLGDTQIVGSSPEVLVRVQDRKVTVRPIAGTRPKKKPTEAAESRNTPTSAVRPSCRIAGVPSMVCTRFGLMASFMGKDKLFSG